MKKTFILTALIVFIGLVPSTGGFAENSCGGQEVTNVIVRALGWELLDELLSLEVVWQPSGSAGSTCPSIGGSPAFCEGAFCLPQAVRTLVVSAADRWLMMRYSEVIYMIG